MRAFLYSEGKATELAFAEGSQRGDEELVWLHFDGRRPEAPAWIEAHPEIPEIARRALLATETRPRTEEIGDGILINLRGLGATPDDDPDPLVSLRCWAKAGRVISFTYRSPLFVDPVIDAFLGGAIEDPGDLVSALADAITEQLNPHIADLGDDLDECEVNLEKSGLWASRKKVSRARSNAISYRRFVAPQRVALERLAAAKVEWLDEHDRLHLREAADRAARMAEELESVRERAAVMQDQLTDLRAEQLDQRALLVSVIALIFLPLTFITGLLGMNVKGIPYADESWAFWGVVGFCAAIGILTAAYFIRAHWISRG
jgi:zinc transporter